MIIDPRSITAEPRQFHFTLEEAGLSTEMQDNQILGFEGPLDALVTVYKAGNKVVLDGRIRGPIRSACDRCLAEYARELKGDFRLLFVLPAEGMPREDAKVPAENDSFEVLTGEEIDLGEIAREQVFLALPMRSLCKETCAGLCPVCGVNRNRQACTCSTTAMHPAFVKLKDLKLKGEKA